MTGMARKARLVTTLATFLVLAAAAYAQTGFLIFTQGQQAIDGYFEGGKLKQEHLDKMNAQLKEVPKELVSLFGNNRINIYVTLDDGSTTSYYTATTGGRVAEVLKGTKDDADLEVRLPESTIDRIALSKDPVGEFLGAMGDGEIKYRGLTPEGEAKGIIVNITTMVAGFFNGLFDFIAGLFK